MYPPSTRLILGSEGSHRKNWDHKYPLRSDGELPNILCFDATHETDCVSADLRLTGVDAVANRHKIAASHVERLCGEEACIVFFGGNVSVNNPLIVGVDQRGGDVEE